MRYINRLKLLETLIEGKPSDSKVLLADVDRAAVVRALQQTKDGLPRPVRVTYESIEEENLARMPRRDKERLWELYSRVRDVPAEVLPEFLALQRRYPNVPSIYNYVAIAYFYDRQFDKYYEALLETVEKFPNYLFGKISLAEYYLNRNEHRQVPKVLDGKFELQLHYPTVDVFHVSEVRSFFNVVGIYFARVNNLTRALYHYLILTDIAPDHVSTKKLGDEIVLKEFGNMNRMFSRRKNRRRKKRR